MKKIQYLDIIKSALLITWKNKFLWLFGFFVLLGSLATIFDSGSNTQNNAQSQSVSIFFQTHQALATCIVLAALTIIFALFVLKIVGNSGLIKAINNIVVYRQTSVSGIILEVKKYIWKLLILEVVIALSLGVIAAILFIPIVYLLSLNNFLFASLSFVLAFFIIFPLIVLAYFLRRYAYMYIILGEMKVKLSLEAAYNLLEKNFKESLIMGCISILLNLLLFAFLFFAIVLVALVAMPFLLVTYFILTKLGAIIVGGLFGVLGILILITIACAFEVFLQAAWVLFFKEISFEKQNQKTEEEKVQADVTLPNPEAV